MEYILSRPKNVASKLKTSSPYYTNLYFLSFLRLNQEINELHQTLAGVQASIDERDSDMEKMRKELADYQQRVAQFESQYQILKEEHDR